MQCLANFIVDTSLQSGGLTGGTKLEHHINCRNGGPIKTFNFFNGKN